MFIPPKGRAIMSWLPRKCVVAPVDFTDDCFEAAKLALQFVDDVSDLHVIHVLPRISSMEPGVVWGEVNDESRKEHITEALRKRLTGEEFKGVRIAVLIGKSPNRIADYAEKQGADLIVMPSHVTSRGKRFLIGSVTDRVTHMAHCPVLVLRK